MAVLMNNLRLQMILSEASSVIQKRLSSNPRVKGEIEKEFEKNLGRMIIYEERLEYIKQTTSRCILSIYRNGPQFTPMLELCTPLDTRRYMHPYQVAENMTPNMRKMIRSYTNGDKLVEKMFPIEKIESNYSINRHPFNGKNQSANPDAMHKALMRRQRKLNKVAFSLEK